MAKTNYTNIDEYHNTLETAVLSRLQTVRELIHEVAPDVLEVISYQIPAFKIHGKFLIYYAAYRGIFLFPVHGVKHSFQNLKKR